MKDYFPGLSEEVCLTEYITPPSIVQGKGTFRECGVDMEHVNNTPCKARVLKEKPGTFPQAGFDKTACGAGGSDPISGPGGDPPT